MTTEQFHNALLQGRGSTVLAVREDLEAYREEVLWACRELIAFDTQCEGSRAWLVYELVGCYPDREPFLQAACDALIACPSEGDWHLDGLAELLEYFVQDGSTVAWKALLRKYRQLFHQMHRVGPPEGYWAARDDYEHLCVILSWCRDHCIEIAHDIGRLSLETPWLKDWEFDWFYAAKARKYLRSMTRAAEKDPCLAEFLRVHETAYQESQTRQPGYRGKRLPRHCTDPERVEAARQRCENAATEEEKAEALDAFRWFPYPGDPAPLIRDAQSDHERLHHTAWHALENIRHPSVREFVLTHLYDKEDAFGVFAANYEDRDAQLLMDRLRAVPIDFDSTTTWHGDQGAVLKMKKPPREALQYIFDTTYCSCCRFHALEDMGKRRMLTPELLEECRYDANDDIRAYARRALNRRKHK